MLRCASPGKGLNVQTVRLALAQLARTSLPALYEAVGLVSPKAVLLAFSIKIL
jgi:hypothetical protein